MACAQFCCPPPPIIAGCVQPLCPMRPDAPCHTCAQPYCLACLHVASPRIALAPSPSCAAYSCACLPWLRRPPACLLCRLYMLEGQCDVWNGVISAAVYIALLNGKAVTVELNSNQNPRLADISEVEEKFKKFHQLAEAKGALSVQGHGGEGHMGEAQERPQGLPWTPGGGTGEGEAAHPGASSCQAGAEAHSRPIQACAQGARVCKSCVNLPCLPPNAPHPLPTTLCLLPLVAPLPSLQACASWTCSW